MHRSRPRRPIRSFTSPRRAPGVYPPRRARSLRRFAHSPLRPHHPQFPVHKIKTRNRFSNHNLANSPPPNLLQMHQPRHRAPEAAIFQSRNIHQPVSRQTTNNKQQTADKTNPPRSASLSTQHSVLSTSRANRATPPPHSSFPPVIPLTHPGLATIHPPHTINTFRPVNYFYRRSSKGGVVLSGMEQP